MNRILRIWLVTVGVFAFLFLPRVALAFDVPEPDGAVTDLAHVLKHEDHIEQEIAAYKARTGNEIGVLIVPTLDGESIEDVAYRTFKRWGVGKKEVDNGVLFVLATKEHRTRIETGRGIGDKLTDIESAHILDRIAPKLRAGRFDDGIEAAVHDIENALGGATHPTTTKAASSASSSDTLVWFLVGGLGLLGLFLLLARRRRGGGYGGSGYASYSSSSFDSSSSYSGGGGGYSGGGGGFSGGDSGGGGSSGSY